MFGEPLRAHRAEFDEAGATANRGKKGDDEYPDRQRDTDQNQHGYSRLW